MKLKYLQLIEVNNLMVVKYVQFLRKYFALYLQRSHPKGVGGGGVGGGGENNHVQANIKRASK